jgi:SsrA-binding protein
MCYNAAKVEILPINNGANMVIENKKAKFNFFIEDTFQCGIELVGCEVKSVRNGNVNIADSFIKIADGEVFLVNANISTYDKTSQFAPDPKRTRKLLLHKNEIEKLIKKTQIKGYALFPLKVYFVRGLVKVDIGVGRGKKLFNKKDDIKIRDNLRQAERDIKAAK